MVHTVNPERENDSVTPPTTDRPAATGSEAEDAGTVGAEIRITPLSLLWSSGIGTVVLGLPLLAGAWALPVQPFPVWSSSSGAALPLSSGLWLIPAFGALLLALFATGYRRHGRPVPTEAWIQDGALAVKVPTAWGKLIREALYLEDPHLEESPRKGRRGARPSSASHSPEPAGAGLVVTGTAEEWWDPGTYEVSVAPTDAERLRSRLTSEAEETTTQ